MPLLGACSPFQCRTARERTGATVSVVVAALFVAFASGPLIASELAIFHVPIIFARSTISRDHVAFAASEAPLQLTARVDGA
jgi:hypothetical protein